jgi:hypothetical protein
LTLSQLGLDRLPQQPPASVLLGAKVLTCLDAW